MAQKTERVQENGVDVDYTLSLDVTEENIDIGLRLQAIVSVSRKQGRERSRPLVNQGVELTLNNEPWDVFSTDSNGREKRTRDLEFGTYIIHARLTDMTLSVHEVRSRSRPIRKPPTDWEVQVTPHNAPSDQYIIFVKLWNPDGAVRNWSIGFKMTDALVHTDHFCDKTNEDGVCHVRLDTSVRTEVFVSVVGASLSKKIRVVGPRQTAERRDRTAIRRIYG